MGIEMMPGEEYRKINRRHWFDYPGGFLSACPCLIGVEKTWWIIRR